MTLPTRPLPLAPICAQIHLPADLTFAFVFSNPVGRLRDPWLCADRRSTHERSHVPPQFVLHRFQRLSPTRKILMRGRIRGCDDRGLCPDREMNGQLLAATDTLLIA